MKFTGQNKKKQLSTINIDQFSGGTNTLVDEARLNTKFAVQSGNLMQVQDGLWKTRWGRGYYGHDYGATIDGASEFVATDKSTRQIVVSGGKAWRSVDAGAATEITGATFTSGLQCYFLQVGGYLYIANGTDPLARYDGSVLTTYSEISAPTNLSASLVASGLSSGTYVYYAKVTALNTVGETVGSTEASITVNKKRDNWTASTDKTTWSWTASAGATAYQLYISSATGYEVLLTAIPAGTTNFTDDGTTQINEFVETPNDNTTGAPKFISMTTSGNRIWATNNTNSKYRVYWSGTGQFLGTFSDFYGGGYIDLERGGREFPISVKHYQTGAGVGVATVFCSTPDGRGAVWQISISSATVGTTTFSLPSATKVVGSFGTESVLGTVATTNDIAFPNRRGWFYLGPEKQFQGILRTNEKSSNIRPYWRNLSGSAMSGVAAYFYDAKIFISVPSSSAGNDRIIILDTERDNWAVDWSFGAKQFFEYTTTSKVTKFLYVPTSGTRICEISENILNDFGAAFYQSYLSPLIPVSKIKTDIMTLKEGVVELGRPKGVITFSLLGIGKDNSFATIGTKTITDFGAGTGIGTDAPGSEMPGSTNSNVRGGAGLWAVYLLSAPSTFAQSATKKAIKLRNKVYSLQFQVSSTTADTQFTILSLQAKGSIIQRRLPSSWTN